jgi:hypothetical protein
MKSWNIILMAGTFSLFAGCASPPDNASDVAVRVGMSQTELRVMYGAPVRIESNASGGEDWYYRFFSRYSGPVSTTASSQTTDANGNVVSSSSESWQVGKSTDEEPIHLSAEGYVIGPLPSGKVLKN